MNKIEEATFPQTQTCFTFLALFSKNCGFVKRATLIVQKKLDCIDTYDIENLEDSPRLEFTDEEIWGSHRSQ